VKVGTAFAFEDGL